ncbi:unnamed protein product [Clonostachys solani]|uniref:Uncharacterized protein n=1 Tax=Clonostachys solani TaxID=160281 RepID=A0A9P0EQK4_9HYPO|nr:unnamed protein product [Clonostachys solani]
MNPDTNQHPFGSHHQPLEPSVQGQTTQSGNGTQLEGYNHQPVQISRNHTVHQPIEYGQTMPRYVYRNQPNHMASSPHATTGSPFSGEPVHNNGLINRPQAPTTMLSPSVSSPTHANCHISPTPFLQTQNLATFQESTWQHRFYGNIANIPPRASEPAAYTSLHDQRSTNDFHYDVAQQGLSRAQKRQRLRSPERGTAANSVLQQNMAQAEDSQHRYEHTRAAEIHLEIEHPTTQALSPRDPTSSDPTRPKNIPARFVPYVSAVDPTKALKHRREMIPAINKPEDFNDLQLIEDCQSQEPAVPGNLKYSNRTEAFTNIDQTTCLLFKKPDKCTYPSNDPTFPLTDEEDCFYVEWVLLGINKWDLYLEHRACLPKKERDALQRALYEMCWKRRQQNSQNKGKSSKASNSGGSPIRTGSGRILSLADLLPTPEQVERMPSLKVRQEEALGQVLNPETAEQLSWRLVLRIWYAQQGDSGARLGTGKDGAWESYPSFLERFLAVVNLLTTSKTMVRNLLSVGDGWLCRIANNPRRELAFKVENERNNLEKKFKTRDAASKKAGESQLSGVSAEPPCLDIRDTASGSDHLGEAEEGLLSFFGAEGLCVDPRSLEDGHEPDDAVEAALLWMNDTDVAYLE